MEVYIDCCDKDSRSVSNIPEFREWEHK